MIELLSTDSKAPPKGVQRAMIRRDGTQPEKSLDFPDDIDVLKWAMLPEQDIICIAHPKVLGKARIAGAFLEAMGRMGTKLKLPDEPAVALDDDVVRRDFIGRMATTPWDATKAKEPRGPGRPSPRGRRAPTEAEREDLLQYWHDTDVRWHVTLSVAKDMLGWTPERHNLNDWLGPRNPKFWVYRHISEDGKLLYVGVTNNLKNRTEQHKFGSEWFDEVADITSKQYDTRREALDVEAATILLENPAYNGEPQVSASRIKRLIKQGYLPEDFEWHNAPKG